MKSFSFSFSGTKIELQKRISDLSFFKSSPAAAYRPTDELSNEEQDEIAPVK